MAPAPSRAPPGQIHFGNQSKCCATLRPNAYLFCDARPRPPASDYKCGDKSNLFGKVPSRARETLAFEALQNSKRGICRLGYTKHLLSSILELRISIRAQETCPSSCATRIASGSLLGGAWQAEPRLLNIFCKNVFMTSPKQVFSRRETTTFRRLEFLMDSGPRKRSSRARETSTF